jgi:hypothetical protein
MAAFRVDHVTAEMAGQASPGRLLTTAGMAGKKQKISSRALRPLLFDRKAI